MYDDCSRLYSSTKVIVFSRRSNGRKHDTALHKLHVMMLVTSKFRPRRTLPVFGLRPSRITNRVLKAKQRPASYEHQPIHTTRTMSTSMAASRRCLQAFSATKNAQPTWAPAASTRAFTTSNTQAQQPLFLDFL